MQRLERPARCRRIGGPASRAARGGSAARQRAEVAGGADQSPAEVVLPDPVDHHARRQRIVGAGDGPGQLEPAAPLAKRPVRRPARSGTGAGPRAGAAGCLVKTFMSLGFDPSLRAWMTGYSGGDSFLSRSTSVRSACSFALESAGRRDST